jgi:hypothetical protein
VEQDGVQYSSRTADICAVIPRGGDLFHAEAYRAAVREGVVEATAELVHVCFYCMRCVVVGNAECRRGDGGDGGSRGEVAAGGHGFDDCGHHLASCW